MKNFYTVIIFLLTFYNTANAQCWESLSAGQLHTVAIRNNGTLWGWGYNNFWQLGLGNNTSVNIPTQIGTDTTWNIVSAGKDFTMAIKNNGTLWAWGSNTSGKLGVGGTSLRTVPTQVGTATDWEYVAASEGDYTLAIKNNGTLWAWGANNNGQLGNGSTTGTAILTPIQIGTDTTWTNVAAGLSHTVALKANGSLWCWGVGGILGDTTTFNKYVPTQVGSALNWQNITAGKRHTLASKTNGTLWSWGDNQAGQLGDGTTVAKKIPTQIGTATSWNTFSAWENSSVATQTNGTLWTWGGNTYGQLGDGTVNNKSTPFQIGTDTDWMELSIGQSNTSAVKITGTRLAWGNNSVGQLGDNTNIDKLSPVVIVCLAPLAIELISFKGEKLEGFNKLTWVINNTSAMDYFEVEKSDNGAIFNALAKVDKTGLNETVTTYNYVDVNPAKKLNYYRLKQIDVDGKIDYSNVIAINNSVTDEIYIFPNPVNNNINILGLSDPTNKIPFKITDMAGKVILKGSILAGENIAVGALNTGLYYIQIGDSVLKFSKN
jgi:alpha-tubulin suppressor-like RCC1 family protein